MKPFRFSLQALSSQRLRREEAARERYAHALRNCETAARRLRTAANELAACWAALGDQLSNGLGSIELLQTRAWCNVLELRVKELATALETAQRGVEETWQELMVATQEREALDRLHHKRRRAYDREAQRQDQKALDELAIQLTRCSVPFRFPAQVPSL